LSKYKPGRRLWLTADRTRAVEEGHRDAAFLLVPHEDAEISEAEAKEYGLLPESGEERRRREQARAAEAEALKRPHRPIVPPEMDDPARTGRGVGHRSSRNRGS
jgi:hypothetical protein